MVPDVPGQAGAMAPADRRLFTDLCRCVLQLAELTPRRPPISGPLGRHGRRRPGLRSSSANDNAEPRVGMKGKPCCCSPKRRVWYTRGCADTCPCHGLAHAECPKAKPCLGALSTGTRNWPFLHVARHLPSLRPDHREQRNPGNGHHGRGGAPRHAGYGGRPPAPTFLLPVPSSLALQVRQARE